MPTLEGRGLIFGAIIAIVLGVALMAAGLFWMGCVLLLAGTGTAAYGVARVSDARPEGRHSSSRREA